MRYMHQDNLLKLEKTLINMLQTWGETKQKLIKCLNHKHPKINEKLKLTPKSSIEITLSVTTLSLKENFKKTTKISHLDLKTGESTPDSYLNTHQFNQKINNLSKIKNPFINEWVHTLQNWHQVTQKIIFECKKIELNILLLYLSTKNIYIAYAQFETNKKPPEKKAKNPPKKPLNIHWLKRKSIKRNNQKITKQHCLPQQILLLKGVHLSNSRQKYSQKCTQNTRHIHKIYNEHLKIKINKLINYPINIQTPLNKRYKIRSKKSPNKKPAFLFKQTLEYTQKLQHDITYIEYQNQQNKILIKKLQDLIHHSAFSQITANKKTKQEEKKIHILLKKEIEKQKNNIQITENTVLVALKEKEKTLSKWMNKNNH